MNAELSGATGGEEHSQSPARAGRGHEPLSFPWEGSNSCWSHSWGRKRPEDSALPLPGETTLQAVIAQPLHNFDPRCVPWERDPRPEGVGKQAGASSLPMLWAG